MMCNKVIKFIGFILFGVFIGVGIYIYTTHDQEAIDRYVKEKMAEYRQQPSEPGTGKRLLECINAYCKYYKGGPDHCTLAFETEIMDCVYMEESPHYATSLCEEDLYTQAITEVFFDSTSNETIPLGRITMDKKIKLRNF